MKEIEQSLRRLGATNNATKLFIESYRTGKASVSKLAQKAQMDRSSAYLAFEQLKTLGLIKEDTHGKVKEVRAVPPQTVISLIQRQMGKLNGDVKAIEGQLSALTAVYGTDSEAVVLQSFSGRETLYRITTDVLESKTKEVRIITNQQAERRVFSAGAHDEFIQTRVKSGIKALVLAADTPEAGLLKKYDKRELRETRIRADLKPFKNETYIYGEKVAVLMYEKDVFGFIVHAKEFAELQRYMFDKIWNQK